MCSSVAPHPSQPRSGSYDGRSIDIWLLYALSCAAWLTGLFQAQPRSQVFPLPRSAVAIARRDPAPWTAVWNFATLAAADIGHVIYRYMVTSVHVSYRAFRQVQTWSVWICRNPVLSSLSPLQGDAGHVVRTPSEVGHFGWYRLSDKSWLTPGFLEETSSSSVVTTACLFDDRTSGRRSPAPSPSEQDP